MPPGVSHFIILGIVCGAICSDKSGARVFYSLHTSSSRRCMGLLWNIEHLNLLLYQRRHMETRPKRSGFIILNFIQANERAKRACIILRNCKSRNYPLLTLVSYSTYDIYLHWGYRNEYRKLCRTVTYKLGKCFLRRQDNTDDVSELALAFCFSKGCNRIFEYVLTCHKFSQMCWGYFGI